LFTSAEDENRTGHFLKPQYKLTAAGFANKFIMRNPLQ